MLRTLLTTDPMEVADADVGCNEEVDQTSSSGGNVDESAALTVTSVSGGDMADAEMKEEIVEEEVVSPEGEVDLANAADADGDAPDGDAASVSEAEAASATTGSSSSGGCSGASSGGKRDKSKGIGPVYHTPGSNMKLIKLVRKEPCLWDPRHVQYR